MTSSGKNNLSNTNNLKTSIINDLNLRSNDKIFENYGLKNNYIPELLTNFLSILTVEHFLNDTILGIFLSFQIPRNIGSVFRREKQNNFGRYWVWDIWISQREK